MELTVPLDQLLDPSVQAVLDGLSLQVVGWIFTDLTADGKGQGAVKHYRGSMVCPLFSRILVCELSTLFILSKGTCTTS